ncbi:MPPbeta [Symbiodinium natans]|uniref:MPPbeta protein n=1 Tax=Symbiodinium natans TaxID=878477 RepID=A0A812KU43_9DINO|nr:MPPbeta [Symbiodinium natans]
MAWNQAPVTVTTLPNGVRVATKETFAETASVGVYLDAGVRDETKETRGATYLLEQLSLTGTTKRPMAKLEAEIESLGATLDLSYGREHSAFNMTMFKGDLAQGVDILADMVTAPALGNLAKEKQGILRKLEDVEQPTRQVIDDRLHACAFRDYSLGFSTVGPFEGIETLTQDHLKKYHETNFTADKMVIASSGAVKHEELVKLAEKAFGGVKAGPPRVYTTKPYFCGAQLLYRNDEMGPLAYISTGWEAVPWKSPDAVTFMVMQAIIGSYKKNAGLVPGSISGNRVTNSVANKMGVGCAEEYECFMHFYKDTGMFGWYIVCDEVAVEHAVGELMFGCNLLSFSVTDEEVERAKRELKATLVNGSGSTRDSCNQVGKEVLAYGRGVPPAEMMLRIDAVDAEEVKRVSYKYLNDQEISCTALGPLHGMPELYIMRQATALLGNTFVHVMLASTVAWADANAKERVSIFHRSWREASIRQGKLYLHGNCLASASAIVVILFLSMSKRGPPTLRQTNDYSTLQKAMQAKKGLATRRDARPLKSKATI